MCVLLIILSATGALPLSATVRLANFIQPFTQKGNYRAPDDVIQLPKGKITCLNFELMSSQLLLNGQNDTTIIREPPRSDEPISPMHQQFNRHKIQSRMFAVRNATLSLSQVRMELDEKTTNSEVLFASICSSIVHASHIEFIRSGWGPLMTLERMEEYSNVDTSVTITKCAIHSKSGRMGATLSDSRGSEGLERIFLSILSCYVGDQQIVGQDGIGVGEGPDNKRFLEHSGITTSFIGISFWNVSSLPGSVTSASSSFRQQMIGSSVWGSNNHLSGSTVRDMNSGGSVLCSNTTFKWCSTTSEERPSSSPLRLSSLSSNTIFDHDTCDGKLGDTRLNITTDTTITNCIFQHMYYITAEMDDGGSALILNTDATYLTVDNCTFFNCSVSHTMSSGSVAGGCILLRGSYSNRLRSTLTVTSCSFSDWYPRNSKSSQQRGGGVGTSYTSAPLSIVESNFTLSGGKTQYSNGGFLSIHGLEDVSSPITISNCRLQGDGNVSDNCLSFRNCKFGSDGLTISDTQIVNTNSFSEISAVTGVQPFVVTRSTFVIGTLLVKSKVVTSHDPLLFVDCTLDVFRIESTDTPTNLYFVGTTFRTNANSSSTGVLKVAGPCFVIFQGCRFEGVEAYSHGLIFCYKSVSLTLDTCTVKECKTTGSCPSLFDLENTVFRAHSCTFSNLTGVSSTMFIFRMNGSILLEGCRFDLEPSTKADFNFVKSLPSLLNTSSVIGCTSNRAIRVTTNGKTFTESPLFNVCPIPNPKCEIELKVDSDDNGKPIETMDKLSPAIQQLGMDSSTILSLSDGWFTETLLVPVTADIEIVGSGTETVHLTIDESPRHHTTKLKAMLNVKAGADLTLRSMTLLPPSISSPLVAMNEEGNLNMKTVVVSAKQDRTKELFCVSAGTAHFFHSRFSSIAGSSALIVVSGTGSLFLSDTLFLTISRIHTESISDLVQSGSCVEGKTSGSISIQFCKFGGCSSTGRAGAIDIVSDDTTSRVEMEGCQFDQNLAGSELDETEKGNDVVLKGFSDEHLTLNFTSIGSFPSLIPFLIDDSHPIVPPPLILVFSQKGLNIPLAWSSHYILLNTHLPGLKLQILLGSRLHNNVHTAITTNFVYTETMTPFSLRNSSISLSLRTGSQINITQPDSETFGSLLNASLSLSYFTLSFSQLKNTAFTLDHDSSLSLTTVNLTFTTKTLTHPFIDSTGRSIVFSWVNIATGLTLEGVSFVRHVRSTNDGTFAWKSTAVTVISLTTQPFLHLEGMSSLEITPGTTKQIKNIFSRCDGSFLFAKRSNVTLSTLSVASCTAQRGGFAFYRSCNVTFKECEFANCSAQHGGVIFLELDNDYRLTSDHTSSAHSHFANCKATATDENGVAIGRGGAICVKETTTAKKPIDLTSCSFERNTAAFGNDVFVEKSVLGDEGPDCLKGCRGESRSDWPHLEVEAITKEDDKDEWTRIATFINFPTIKIDSRSGTDDFKCRFSNSKCRTLTYAFRYLNETFPNGTVYPHIASLSGNFTFDPMILENVNMLLGGSPNVELKSTVAAGSSMFTVKGESRLSLQSFDFLHKANHTLVSVTSSEAWLELLYCDVIFQSGTYSQTLISSVGNGLSLSYFRFNNDYKSPQITFTVPLISFLPTPSQEGGLGSASFSIVYSIFANLSLTGSPIIVVETSGDLTFQTNTFTQIQSGSIAGKYFSMKGHTIKQQITAEEDTARYSKVDLTTHLCEDTSLVDNHKWRRGPLLYWLFSPSNEVILNKTNSTSTDHPNCGSPEFKCSTLDSALESASLNSLEVITLSSPSSLQRRMTVNGTRTVRSSNSTQREVSVSLDSSVRIDGGELSFFDIEFVCASSLAFWNSENTRSASLFVVESGSLSLASCSLSSFTHASCPLICHTGGSFSLISSELNSIERVSGKGSILSTEMKNGMELTMDGVILSSMDCSSESPALLVNFSSIQPSSPFPTFSLTNLRFEETDEQSATGHFVEIIGRSISNFISEGDARFSGSYSTDSNENHLWSVDEERSVSASLLFYLLAQEGPVGVSRGGSDVDRCGYLNVWCSSVERAISRTTDRALSELVILGDSDLSVAVTLATNVSMTKGEEAGTVHVSSCGCLTTAAHHPLLVEALSIMLPPTQTAEAVVVVPPSGSATLNTIVVTSPGGSDATLVRVTGGRAEMTDCVIQSEMKENTNLVEIVGEKVSVDTLRVENWIGLNSSIVWMKKGSVNVSGVSIVDVSSISGHLVVASGTSAQLKDILLSHLSVTSTPFLFSSIESCSLSNVSISDFSSGTLIEGKDVKSLELEACHFSGLTKSPTFSNDRNTHTRSLFVVESGSLSLTSCSLSSLTLDSSPLISHVSGSFSLISCELRSIERVSGKGSILSTEMKNGMELTIDGVILSSMDCSSESPALVLNFSSIQPSSPFPTFSLTNLRFEETDEQSATGHFVEIIGRSISNFISEGDARFSGSYSTDSNENHLWSVDEERSVSASLLFYLLAQEGPVGVSRGGSDVDRCGYLNVWCSSVERAISRTTDRALSELVILGDSDLSVAVTLATNVSMTKGEEGSTVHVSSVGSLMTAAHYSLLVEELWIVLPTSQTAEAVVVVPPSGSATLNTIVVTSPGGSDATLVRVTGGRAEMTDCVIQSEMKENTNLVEIVGEKVSVDTLRVENWIGLNSSIVWMKKGSVNVSGVSIVDVSSISGHLVVASGTSAQLKNILLSHISVTSTPFLFSSLDSCSLFNVSANCSSSKALINAAGVTILQLEGCHFSRPAATIYSTVENDDETQLCEWSNSLISLTDCSSFFHFTEMKHLTQGAISSVGSELTLSSCTFLDNSPSNADFPSLRRNVLCSDGKVSIEAVGGDGHSSPNHWISTHNCSVEKEGQLLAVPFIVPTLSSTQSKRNFDRKAKKYEIVLKGETLIPCGLSLEVFERVALSKTEFSEGEHILVELDPTAVTSWTEDTIELSLPQSSLDFLNTKYDLHCRVLFSESGKTDSFSLTGLKGNMSQGGRVVSIVLPIVCSVVFLLFLLIVMLVLICRRHQKKNKEEKTKQMNELDECQIEVKEDEDININTSIKPIFSSSVQTINPNSLVGMSDAILPQQPLFSSMANHFIEHVEVLKCEGDPAVVRVDARKTLYSALHVEHKNDLPKMEIRRQLVAGLDRLIQHNPFSDVLTQLSSHWILLDSSGAVCLKLDQNLNRPDLTAKQIENEKKMREEDRRWSAPEQIDEDTPKESCQANKNELEPQAVPFDTLKASVFRLGLVLWELETGLVPFGELDAVNASRQVKGGQVPLISNWEDPSLASIVEECLSFDPDERPPLSTLKTHFSTSTTSDPPPIQQQPIASIPVTG
ncbi:hypothetical protein BLNAU_13430 [Blattamonas nauphoetae]|uniref:Serine-threonine/tyrosine-protein kinase catalytic domain-containing protein n=1 Tax=Blattamonas nauphoetae TaxID=2049346 RepID=A0ABQ9XI35_9EUKA|nr:hypothetical protein BLNAU_13430 [Blattamonas nauphoetae]